ncbi:hypothetical protein ABL78_0521 [Leptomonas seymouri]|uniref:Protein kinase domain-containing protein n=1 Tax=Leptomonas seymouri TaxID=5684 RepID=A0A0N1IMG7_LEPSE|nr:hypothetical protein ABL78_0521 [Leptomonas seymouri]|eukprot:KPI90295.1 hypothetical protein ABL78_0521 [Leptomonas seymouri]
MFKPVPSDGVTPVRSPSTPQLPTTTARLLTPDVDGANALSTPHLQKLPATGSSARSPLACMFNRNSSSKHGSPSACSSNGQTPKRAVQATGRSAAVPPLVMGSLSISSITSGSPSPLSEWSNKTKKYPRPSNTHPRQASQPVTNAGNGDDCLPHASTGLMALLPEHSQVGVTVNSAMASSCSTTGTPNSSCTRRPEPTSASTPVYGNLHCSRIALNPDGSPFETSAALAAASATTVTGEKESEWASLNTPSKAPQTPERVAERLDVSPCTVSTTSVGGAITPTFLQCRENGGVCEVSCEEERDKEKCDGPVGTPWQSKCLLRIDETVGGVHQQGSEVRPGRLACSDSNVHRYLFTPDTEAYVCATPARVPLAGTSKGAALSPTRICKSLSESDFAAQYPLFLPHVLGLHPGGPQVPAAQATPSHTNPEAHVLAVSAVGQTVPRGGWKAQLTEDGVSGPVSAQNSPDMQRLERHRPFNSKQPITVDAPIQLRHTMNSVHSLPSHGHTSPCSGELDMGTQVFRSGAQVPSPILQRHHTTTTCVTFVGEGSSPIPHTSAYEYPCSPPRIAATLTRRPRDVTPHTLGVNLFEDTSPSLHSQPGTASQSGFRTPPNVSAVAEDSISSCDSDAMASTPLLSSLDEGFYSGQSLSMNGVAASPVGMAEIMHRADTPKSPHTPLDRRTPGPAGLHGSSYASLSEHSYGISQHQHHHRPMLSQPMTPRKSTRRSHSLQTTPSQSFRSKVHNHSFESQQQQQAQFFSSHVNGLWAAKSPANTSVSSAVLGEATVVAERDYLAPSRNPFSLYRFFETYTCPVLKPGHSICDAEHQCMDDSTCSDATIDVHSTDQLLTEKQRQFTKELSAAVLRPDAAVVLYEQLIPAPMRAPGSHCPPAKAPSSSQATFDLLLHAPNPRSHVFTSGTLSPLLNGRGVMPGQGWIGNGAAVAVAERRGAEESNVEPATAHSVIGSPPRARSVSSPGDGAERAIPHKEAFLPCTNASPRQPKSTLASCPVLHVPAAAASTPPPRTPSRSTRARQSATPVLGVSAGLPVVVPCHQPVSGSPHSTLAATATTVSPARPCDWQGHDALNSSATSSAAASRHLTNAFTSPNKNDVNYPLLVTDVDSRTNEGDLSGYDEGPSPLPRRPVAKSDCAASNQSSPCTASPLYSERQLLFGVGSTDDDDEVEEHEGRAACANGDAAAVATGLCSPFIDSPLMADVKEMSTGTESSTGSPRFLGCTMADANPLTEKPSSPLQRWWSPHDAAHARAKEDCTLIATLRPSGSSSTAPTGAFLDIRKAADLPSESQQPHHVQPSRRLHASSRCTPALSISTEFNGAYGGSVGQPAPRATSTDPIRSGNEVASVLLPSAYQALGSILDPLETTDEMEEEIPGDRFQAHHEFQFLHYLEAALEAPDGAPCGTPETPTLAAMANGSGASGRPIPLCVEVNGVTWLATHRLNGLPYAVKEVPAVAFNMAELQCLTLSNRSPHGFQGRAQRVRAQHLTPQDMLEAEDYLARYYSVTTPPQDNSKPVVHLLQLEYFPRGSIHDLVHRAKGTNRKCSTSAPLSNSTRSSVPFVFTVEFWRQVVQQGLRGLRVLHHARLVHGSPLTCCLFAAGRTPARLHAKWSCFGSARAAAELYPTESLPPYISEAVLLLYKRHKGDGTVPADVIEVAVFCLGVLELLVEDAEELDTARGLPTPPRAAAKDGRCHLEWIEAMLQRRHSDLQDVCNADEAQLQSLTQFLWDSARSYLSADEVLVQMGVHIDPALHTVEQLYQYEIYRLSRQLQERQQRRRKRLQASGNAFPLDGHHERAPSALSQGSVDLPHEPQEPQRPRKEKKPSNSRGGSGQVVPPWSPGLAAGHGLVHRLPSAPPPDVAHSFSVLRKSPQLFPRRTSTPCAPLPRAPFLDISGERRFPSLGTSGNSLFFPNSTASTKPAVASVPTFSLRPGRSASEAVARGTARRGGKSDVHPRVREAAQAMLINALMQPQVSEDLLSPSLMWREMLAPAVQTLRLRGWMSFYAGVPLSVTGAGKVDGCAEEEVLQSLLASLRPMTSFE